MSGFLTWMKEFGAKGWDNLVPHMLLSHDHEVFDVTRTNSILVILALVPRGQPELGNVSRLNSVLLEEDGWMFLCVSCLSRGYSQPLNGCSRLVHSLHCSEWTISIPGFDYDTSDPAGLSMAIVISPTWGGWDNHLVKNGPWYKWSTRVQKSAHNP